MQKGYPFFLRIVALVLICLCSAVHAQQKSYLQDSLLISLDSLTMKEGPAVSDSLSNVSKHYLDSLNAFIYFDSMRTDTVTQRLHTSINEMRPDTLGLKVPYDTLGKAARQFQGRLTEKSRHVIQKVKDKPQQWKEGLVEKVGNLPVKKMADRIPDSEVGAVPFIPSINSLPDASGDLTGELAPDITLPELPAGSLTGQTPEVEIPGIDRERLDAIDQVTHHSNALKKSTDQLAGYQGNAERYTEQTEQYTSKANNVDALIDQEARGVEELSMLEERPDARSLMTADTEKLDQYKQYTDPEFIKKNMYQKARVVATDLVSKKTEVLQPAITKLANHKKAFAGDRKTVFETKKKDPVKGKTIKERIILSFALQYQKVNDTHQLDLYAQLGYQVTSFWTVGVGYGYRVQYDDRQSEFITERPVHGWRHFQYLTVFKGFYAIGAYEYTKFSTVEGPTRYSWSGNYLVGVGKSYHIFNTVKGNLQALYSFESGVEEVYFRKFNVRFVFDLKFGKVKRPRVNMEGRLKQKREKDRHRANMSL